MAKRNKHLLLVTLAVVLAACASTFEATYDHDRNHDFSSYQTFAWISEHPMVVAEGVGVVNPLLETHVMSAMERGLRAKGFRLVQNPEAADFVIAFTVGSREKIRVDSYPTMAGGYYAVGPRGWGGAYYGYAGTETTVRQYTKGMLAIDIFDVKERRPVWHAVATKTIHDKDREQIVETVNAAVNSILGGFPPPAG